MTMDCWMFSGVSLDGLSFFRLQTGTLGLLLIDCLFFRANGSFFCPALGFIGSLTGLVGHFFAVFLEHILHLRARLAVNTLIRFALRERCALELRNLKRQCLFLRACGFIFGFSSRPRFPWLRHGRRQLVCGLSAALLSLRFPRLRDIRKWERRFPALRLLFAAELVAENGHERKQQDGEK